jgi:type IV secretory pathway VirD2 relaxase
VKFDFNVVLNNIGKYQYIIISNNNTKLKTKTKNNSLPKQRQRMRGIGVLAMTASKQRHKGRGAVLTAWLQRHTAQKSCTRCRRRGRTRRGGRECTWRDGREQQHLQTAVVSREESGVLLATRLQGKGVGQSRGD